MMIGEWLGKAVRALCERGVPEAQANAEFIMAAALRTGRNEVRLDSRRELPLRQGQRFWHLVEARARRIPLGYVLGFQPFLDLDIQVNPRVLIPRPETEEVAAEALRLLKSRAQEPLHILEIGTGTGCIAIALSASLPQATVYATDISPEALSLALKNAEAHHRSGHIRFIKEDLFKPEAERRGWADLVISNPPYIPTSELKELAPEVRREPWMALDGGPDGLRALRAIIPSAPRALKPGGLLVLEIGEGQGSAVRRLLESTGFKDPDIRKDSSGRDRIAIGKMVE